MTSSAALLSVLLDKIELADSFVQAQSLSKLVSQSLKKHSVQFGQTQGLAPVLLVLQPVFPPTNAQNTMFDLKEDVNKSPEDNQANTTFVSRNSTNKGPKGQAHAKVLAELNDMESVIGGATKEINITSSHDDAEKKIAQLTPLESVDVMADFIQMVDVLSDRMNLRRAKRCGNIFLVLANIGADTGTPEMIASFAHELFFTLDVYNRKSRRNIKARVGIHCDFFSNEWANEGQTLKDAWASMGK